MISEKPNEMLDKKTLLLAVAEQLFAEKGFDGTSVRDIANAAQINLAMISYYFGSKEKLLEAIIENKYSFTKTLLEGLIQNESLSPIEKIDNLIETFVSHAFKQQYFHKIMVREQIKGNNSPVYHFLKEYKTKNQSLIKKLIEEGQSKGIFRNNIDCLFMISTLFGTTHHLISSQNFYLEEQKTAFVTEEEIKANMKQKLVSYLKSIIKHFLTQYEQ